MEGEKPMKTACIANPAINKRNRTSEMIREYDPKDTHALIAIWEKANALAHPFLPQDFVAQVKTDMRNIYLPNAETWVLEQQGMPIGFIAMIGNEIGGLLLDPARYGSGWGTAMVDHVASGKGPLKVEVFSANAIGCPFCERYGFLLRDEYLHDSSGQMTARMAMPGAE
jgi:putative acetyltransferase